MKREYVWVKLWPGKKAPPSNEVAKVYHKIANRAGAYAEMKSHPYLKHPSTYPGLRMTRKQAGRFCKILPMFRIAYKEDEHPHWRIK